MKYVDLEQGKNDGKFAILCMREDFKKKKTACLLALYIVDEMIPSNVGIIVSPL